MGSPGESAATVTPVQGTQPAAFVRAAATLRDATVRPDVSLFAATAPARIAPFAEAVSLEVGEFVSARLVYLHDPAGQDAWGGADRLVGFARSGLEPEMAADPLLAEVAWSWLAESLEGRGVVAQATSGTVTVTSNTRFGGIAVAGTTHDLEVRCSWSPTDLDLGPHVAAFADLLATLAGLPPAGRDVVSLNRRRR
jgi:hypothetical protein